MSLKVIKSSLFDELGGTTQKKQLSSIVQQCKQRLRMNSQSTSRFVAKSVEQLKASQAKNIQKLTKKSKSVKFHSIYENYQKIGKIREKEVLIQPQRLASFQKGIHYRCSERTKRVRLQQKIKEELQQYYQRKPEEERNTITHQKIEQKIKRSSVKKKLISEQEITNTNKQSKIEFRQEVRQINNRFNLRYAQLKINQRVVYK